MRAFLHERYFLLLQCLDCNINTHLITDCRRVLTHIEVGTFNDGVGIRTNRVFLLNRVGRRQEACHCQRNALGYAFHSEIALYADWLITLKDNFARFKGNGWVLGRIQKIFSLNMLVEQGRAGIDRARIDGDVDRACFSLFIEGDDTRGFVETLLLG